MKTLLSIQGLSCHFGRGQDLVRAVDDVSLDVHQGEVLGLVGESGSGKSTLGRCIVGLNPKTSGEILLEGQAMPQKFTPADFRRYSRDMQMVFQDSYGSLNARMTVGQSLEEPLRIQRVPRAEREHKVALWLDKVNLGHRFERRYPHQLSGGQRQRVGIARAFIGSPRLVICDEAISALDVSVQAQVVMLLRELCRESSVALVFIAHDLAMVHYLADRTAVMERGKLVEVANSDTLFTSPEKDYTKRLLAASPIADPIKQRDRQSARGTGLLNQT